jgi:hypothetical protein
MANSRLPRLVGIKEAIGRDRAAQVVLAAAALLNALLFIYLAVQVGRLPAEVPLHFNQLGEVDRVGPPAGLFLLPLAGLLAWLVNGLIGWWFYLGRQERPVALVLWGAAVVVQVIAWSAVLGLLAGR